MPLERPIPFKTFDVVFDIDGTLASNEHRLPLIKDMSKWVSFNGRLPGPDWDLFLSPEQQDMDTPIPQTWMILRGLIQNNCRILFITGRRESTRYQTWSWLTDHSCPVRSPTAYALETTEGDSFRHHLLMRPDGFRGPSHEIKRQHLETAQSMGYHPTLAFDDRGSDAKMYRSQGILCMQVSEGEF